MDKEVEQVVSNLRACLLSVKGGIPITVLDRDYKVLIGHPIPYRKLGYDSLEKFLRSIPNMTITTRNGEICLDANPTKSSEHLASLVARQKSAPRARKPPPRINRRTAAMQWRPPPTSVRPMSRPPPRRVHITQGSLRPQLSVTLSHMRGPKPARQTFFSSSENMPNGQMKEGEPIDVESYQFPWLISCPPCTFEESKRVAVNNEIPNSRERNFNSNLSGVSERPERPELPPRFLKQASQTKVPIMRSESLPETLPIQHPVPLLTETGNQDVIQSISELESQVKQLALNSSHTGPVTALQARLKRLTQVPSVLTLGDHVVTALSRNAPAVEIDYRQELQDLTKSICVELPTFKVVPRFPKGEPAVFSCIVKVGEESYNSFPDESQAPAVAIQLAAKRALSELQKRGVGLQYPMTQNFELLKARISELVASHAAGIWNTQVPVDYVNQYHESLPPDWLQIVKDCSHIAMEKVGNSRVILSQCVVTPTSEKNISNKSWQQIQTPIVPDSIVLPTSEVWDVYVTCAITTIEVWVRLIGEEYSVKYEAMSTDMEIHYMEKAIQAVNPEVGHYYAIQLDGCWHRVQLLEKDDDTGLVYFLDHGDEDSCNLDSLYVLEPTYARLPAQAIQVVLSGLEEFADDANATNHLVDTVIGKTLVAQVVSRGSPDDADSVFAVLLYDTSTDEDINVNILLAERISQDACAPRLPEDGTVTEVFLSHVNEEGELYFNIKSESFGYLRSLMDKLMEGGINETHISRAANHSTDPSKLYLARYSVDCEYYRAIVISEPDQKNWVTVQFVDYGNTETVAASSLLLLGQLSETLEKFPYQAIRVVLHGVPQEAFGPRFVERVRELVKDEESALVKVMKSGTDNSPPEVEMFKRTEDKQFISINNTLSLDPDLVKPKPAGESRLRRRHGHRSHPVDYGQGDGQRGLGVPQIPDVGQFFDVHVTMAANPGNFTVQPYKERVHLEELMSKMQDFYKTHPITPVTPDAVKEGSLFAAHHNDGNWYRVTVSNVISGSTVSVYFCDFGDVAFLPLERLQPLSNQFKTLPAQAVKAKLARIMPSHGDWSVEDCIRFQERVVEKQFVSVIVDSGPDLLNPSDIVIGLQLYDTSGNIDVEIDKLLVDEKRAVFTPAVLQQLQNVAQKG